MFKLLLSIFIVLGALFWAQPVATAAETTVHAQAKILDPLTMNYKHAKRLCKEEPYIRKCEIIRHRFKRKKHRNKNVYGPKRRKYGYYQSYNVNFE